MKNRLGFIMKFPTITSSMISPDGLVGSVEHLQQVAAADDSDQPAILVDDRQPLHPGGVHSPGGLGHRRVGVSWRPPPQTT
jgi:hypothetical protein